MKLLAMVLLLLISPAAVMADNLSNLQRQTNQAYEQMRDAENRLSDAKKEVQIKQDNLRYYQEKVAETEKALQAAQLAQQRAEESLSAAQQRWNGDSDNLYQQWHR